MSMVSSNRTPEQIASEINFIKAQSGKMLLYNAVEIGRRLTEAKEVIPHGEWLKWLTESVSYSKSTANRLMKIFREYGPKLRSLPDEEGEANDATLRHLSYTHGLLLFGVPDEEREQFIADNDVGNLSHRELQQAVNEHLQTADEGDRRSEETELLASKKIVDNNIAKPLDKPLFKPFEPIPVETRVVKAKPRQTVERVLFSQEAQEKPETQGEQKARGAERVKSVLPPDVIKERIARYEADFIVHRDNMLAAYSELLITLNALDKVDRVKKEERREAALKIAMNMVETLKKYPPEIMTNMKINRD